MTRPDPRSGRLNTAFQRMIWSSYPHLCSCNIKPDIAPSFILQLKISAAAGDAQTSGPQRMKAGPPDRPCLNLSCGCCQCRFRVNECRSGNSHALPAMRASDTPNRVYAKPAPLTPPPTSFQLRLRPQQSTHNQAEARRQDGRVVSTRHVTKSLAHRTTNRTSVWWIRS